MNLSLQSIRQNFAGQSFMHAPFIKVLLHQTFGIKYFDLHHTYLPINVSNNCNQ